MAEEVELATPLDEEDMVSFYVVVDRGTVKRRALGGEARSGVSWDKANEAVWLEGEAAAARRRRLWCTYGFIHATPHRTAPHRAGYGHVGRSA